MPSNDTRPVQLTDALQRYFGFTSFRAQQEEIVRRTVEGRDTLAIMPTGAGKSLCYQLAAMLRPAPTLVISPLIALMKDQIDNLPRAVASEACLINSSLDPGEVAQRIREVATGKYRLLYAAPERLRQRQFLASLRSAGIGLVVIDEVHCVSMWGHDFRPDYLFIRAALAVLDNPPVLGMTATATPATARDICRSLDRELEVVRSSVVRTNLRYDVRHVENEEERKRVMLDLIKRSPGSGIVYARSRQKCEELALLLQRNGIRALHYHAGLEPAARSTVQERFLSGGARVIVATTAFGMGIDKPDIRWVVLYNYPTSVEDYVQRVGRAGRDGDPSTCTLLASVADAVNLRRFARADLPTVDRLRAIYRRLQGRRDGDWAEVTPEDLAIGAEVREGEDPRVLVGMLERAGLVRRGFDAGRAMRIEVLPPPSDAPERIQRLLQQYHDQSLERAARMIGLADARRCRHLQVAEHFGESISVPCGRCDVCAPHESRSLGAPEAAALPDDIARAIMDTLETLPYPVGVRGLVSTLRGSIDAPPTAQRSDHFGVLAAASGSAVRRWVEQLLENGNLEVFESDNGFRLLRRGNRDDLPRLAGSAGKPRSARGGSKPADDLELDADQQNLFERLRAWRLSQARDRAVPAYVIMHDSVLRSIASLQPSTREELSTVSGLGPNRLELYGDAILSLVEGGEPAAAV